MDGASFYVGRAHRLNRFFCLVMVLVGALILFANTFTCFFLTGTRVLPLSQQVQSGKASFTRTVHASKALEGERGGTAPTE
jgi:hypothetical protein